MHFMAFNKYDRGGGSRGGGFQSRGRSSFGDGRNFGGGNDRGPREMFKAVCDNCGKDCEVPFRPTSGKPVYCSDCFEKKGGRDGDSRRPNARESRPQAPRVDLSIQFDSLNVKLDKIIKLLEPKLTQTVVEEQ
jgi:CxxC-x17-CxxC domain-containing protein